MTDEIFQPFRAYLEAKRRSLLTELDEIEKLIGISPRTAEIRKRYNRSEQRTVPVDGESVVGVMYNQEVERI